MKTYIHGFSIDYEDAVAGLNRPQNLPDYVPEGKYYAMIVDAFTAPNSAQTGMNLVVDFSIHDISGHFHGWIMRKYFGLSKPGYQLKLLFQGMEASPDVELLIGRMYDIVVVKSVGPRGIGTDIHSFALHGLKITEGTQRAIDTLFESWSPTERSVYKRELSVDYHKHAASAFILTDPDKEVDVSKYHRCTKNWMATHILGHSSLMMAPQTSQWLVARWMDGWNYDMFEKMVVIKSELGTYVLIGGVSRKEAEKVCRENKVRLPLPAGTPVPMPWRKASIEEKDGPIILNPDAGSTIQDQIEYMRRFIK